MRVISLFSGAGGLDLGFKKAGFRIVYANDVQEEFCKTYRENVGDIQRDNIKDVDDKAIPGGEIVIGGFPCLGFTIGRGYRRKSDPVEEKENFLYKEFLRVVERKNPRLFLMENVPGIRGGPKYKSMFTQILRECREAGKGYLVEYKELNALHWGVPQNRKRIFITGVRKGVKTACSIKNFLEKYPPETHVKARKPVTIKEAIGDLPLEESNVIPNHVGSKHKVKVRDYPGNRTLDWNSPSPTITGRGSVTGGPVIHPHPSMERRLTVRECARLQSFPDDFIFHGSISKGYAQVGNAVPPLLSFRIGQVIMLLLGEKPRKYNSSEWDIPWRESIPRLDSDSLVDGGLNG